jgi:hypothetical protein
MIDCSTSFKLVCPDPDKSSTTKIVWMPVNSRGRFLISFPAVSTTFEQFHELVAEKCDEKSEGAAGGLIRNALVSGTPKLDWKVWMKLPADNEFKKSADYKVNNIESFTHWTATVISNGKDRANVTMERKMISPADLAKDVRTAVKVKQHVITQGAAQLGCSGGVQCHERLYEPDL